MGREVAVYTRFLDSAALDVGHGRRGWHRAHAQLYKGEAHRIPRTALCVYTQYGGSFALLARGSIYLRVIRPITSPSATPLTTGKIASRFSIYSLSCQISALQLKLTRTEGDCADWVASGGAFAKCGGGGGGGGSGSAAGVMGAGPHGEELANMGDGEYRESASVKTFDLFNPATEELDAKVSYANRTDVDATVDAALTAFSRVEQTERLIRENVAELASLEARSMGIPVSQYPLYAAGVAAALEHFAALALFQQGVSSLNSPGYVNMTLIQPYGVVGAILPWNVPLHMFAFKVGPALAASNTVVVKTSEKAPLTVSLHNLFSSSEPFALTQVGRFHVQCTFVAGLLDKAGIPKGVVNVIHGWGDTGGLVASHMRVRRLHLKADVRICDPVLAMRTKALIGAYIRFTGSGITGRKVATVAINSYLKNVTLERVALGGKSPAIVSEDADLENAASSLAFSMFRNRGQICAAQSRLYVQKSVKDKFIKLYKMEWTDLVKHGDPLDRATTEGPLADQLQYQRVMKYISVGKQEGTLVFGGERVGNKGYFVQPTLFTNLKPGARVVNEEISGLSLSHLKEFETEEEVSDLANDTQVISPEVSGLSSSVFTKDVNRAMRLAQAIAAGNVNINTGNTTAFVRLSFALPFHCD
ncbi:ALDH-like protein [Calocera viscosa TUFC12733]|uniref:ALDH-like protein n=1 Tax=Calocera viscosa (strain TUFC12733) TaxID=1330018 RepID=A0A167HBQ2_CALVF|nr:ALDH-like protein [Calocera viscosa TUFC12733]